MKGFLLFCGLVLVMGLVWLALSHLDDRDKLYEERLVGALQFTEEIFKSVLNFKVDLYEPAIRPQAKADHWRLSGIVGFTGGVGGSSHAAFTAVLENLCPDFAKSSCWRVEELVVAGQPVYTTRQAE